MPRTPENPALSSASFTLFQASAADVTIVQRSHRPSDLPLRFQTRYSSLSYAGRFLGTRFRPCGRNIHPKAPASGPVCRRSCHRVAKTRTTRLGWCEDLNEHADAPDVTFKRASSIVSLRVGLCCRIAQLDVFHLAMFAAFAARIAVRQARIGVRFAPPADARCNLLIRDE